MSITLYTIYDHPSDYPQYYVVRRWYVFAGFAYPSPCLTLAETLEGAREALPGGLVNLGRDGEHDPVILEVWA